MVERRPYEVAAYRRIMRMVSRPGDFRRRLIDAKIQPAATSTTGSVFRVELRHLPKSQFGQLGHSTAITIAVIRRRE
jgi:hypothetical protein